MSFAVSGSVLADLAGFSTSGSFADLIGSDEASDCFLSVSVTGLIGSGVINGLSDCAGSLKKSLYDGLDAGWISGLFFCSAAGAALAAGAGSAGVLSAGADTGADAGSCEAGADAGAAFG